jgi:two-component system sensor histidine kinase CpxA
MAVAIRRLVTKRLFTKIVLSVSVALVLVVVFGNIAAWLASIPADDPQNLGLVVRLATAVAVIVLLCAWLARHVTTPVARLRTATQQLAAGDLATRVRGVLGGRQDEIGDLGRHFDVMAARMEALIGSQRQLLRDVSHELRSPLARLSLAVGLARRHAPPETTAQLDRIEQEAERLNQLIGQLLSLARLESGGQPAPRVAFDVARIVDEVAADGDFEARGQGRSVRIVRSTSCVAFGAPDLLRSAVENIVRNGIRHTPAGTSVDITLTCPPAPEGPSHVAELLVRDHGSGVPDAALPHLFKPFYRVPGDAASSRNGAGAGLGLAITERAVTLLGGHVSATNAADGGLAVTIVLPLAPAWQPSS